jgi:5-formyltetrahydrofolate cyclo-ligase
VTPDTSAVRDPRRAQRRELRARRNALPPGRRQILAQRIDAYAARLPEFRRAAAIGLYAHFGSEVPTLALRALARRRGCRLYLPHITNFATYAMVFSRDFGCPLRRNRLGIGEAPSAPTLDVAQLDLLLMPLVGFDDAGNRLGNGAGYYDRLLGARLGHTVRRALRPRPLLVGLAFECQHLGAITAAVHDVPLDAVISECGLRYFHRE